MAKKDSFYNTFSCGNEQTLKQEGVREALLKFHSEYYSSNIMTLCVLSNASIDQLAIWVTELFIQVENKQVKVPDLSTPCSFDKSNTHKFVKFVPVQDEDKLIFSWSLPYCEKLFRTKPLSFISSLIGHEGPNSLLSYLIK